jgi:hypothetical protein
MEIVERAATPKQKRDVHQDSINPFVGPRAYTEKDCKLFFGRATEIGDIVHLVLSSPIFFVFGDSGVGKTSLVRAGLKNRFEKHNVKWKYHECTSKYTKDDALKEFKDDVKRVEQALIICFDAFEKVFIQGEDYFEMTDFFRTIIKLCNENENIHIIFVLRSEWLARLDQYAGLLPEGLESRYRVDPMSQKTAEETILEVSRKSEHCFKREAAQWIIKELQRADRPTGFLKIVNLTLLQVVCQKIWEKAHSNHIRLIKEGWLENLNGQEELVAGCLAEFFENKLKATVNFLVRSKNESKDELEARLRRWLSESMLTDGHRKTVPIDESLSGGISELEKHHIIKKVEVRTQASTTTLYELDHDRWVSIIRDSNERWEAHGKVYLLGATSFKELVTDQALSDHVDHIALGIREKEEREKAKFDPQLCPLDLEGDFRRHRQAQAHIGLMVLEGKVSLARFDQSTYKHLQWVRVRVAKEVRAYLLWQREGLAVIGDEAQRLKYYFQACHLLKEQLYKRNLKAPHSGQAFKNLKSYLQSISGSTKNHHIDRRNKTAWANGNEIRFKIVSLKAAQLQADRGSSQSNEKNWLDAERYSQSFYESVLPAIENETKIEELRKAIDFGRKYSLISCFEAAILMYFADVELIQKYGGLDKIVD